MYDQIETLADFPESRSLSAENDDFPFEIRDKLLGFGSRPGYRGVFTIKDDAVYVLTVRRAAQDELRPDEIDPPPSSEPRVCWHRQRTRQCELLESKFRRIKNRGRPAAGGPRRRN